jgi:hypothetical protein
MHFVVWQNWQTDDVTVMPATQFLHCDVIGLPIYRKMRKITSKRNWKLDDEMPCKKN